MLPLLIRIILDENVVNFTSYTYYVTAIYSETGDESDPSNMVTITPLPPMAFPFTDDYETGALYWNFEGSWGLASNQSHSPTHSMTESPNGSYGDELDISATLYNFSLEAANSASLSFWAKWSLEADYDYTHLQISTNGINWTDLEVFNGTQNAWTQKTYSLSDYLGEPLVLIRFRFISDVSVTADGMNIDDFVLDVVGSGTGIGLNPSEKASFEIYPNPVSDVATIKMTGLTSKDIQFSVFDLTGSLLSEKTTQATGKEFIFNFVTSKLPAGIYYCVMKTGDASLVKKLTVIK